MPLYDFSCSSCSHTFEIRLPMDDRMKPTTEPCPNCQQATVTKDACSPLIGDPVRLGIIKPPTEFRELLTKIKKRNPKSNMNVR